jgi:uncharacterized SAM-binding protein YcdF (DUF218 family)
MGVPAGQIIIENQALDTSGNAYYTAQILKARGLGHPVLITSAYHMKRGVKAFAAEGLVATPFACAGTGELKAPILTDILPNAGALDASSRALKEYMGLFAQDFFKRP